MHRTVFGINFQIHFASLTNIVTFIHLFVQLSCYQFIITTLSINYFLIYLSLRAQNLSFLQIRSAVIDLWYSKLPLWNGSSDWTVSALEANGCSLKFNLSLHPQKVPCPQILSTIIEFWYPPHMLLFCTEVNT